MRQYYMIIDIALCQNCASCALACKDEFFGNNFSGYSLPQMRLGQKWIWHERRERGQGSLMDVHYRPALCMHCANPACAAADESGAVAKRDDGIVLIDPEKARGARALAKACPYGAISWNEEAQAAQKCTMCAHLLDAGWDKTRCAQICPTGAINIAKLTEEECAALLTTGELEAFRPELGSKPHVLYRNLKLITKEFIAGSVSTISSSVPGINGAARVGGVGGSQVAATPTGLGGAVGAKDVQLDCLPGASVRLMQNGRELAAAVTDAFGDFKFDGFDKGSGDYTIQIDAGTAGTTEVAARLGESVYLSDIRL